MSQVIITEIYLESTRRLLPSLKLGDSGDVDGVLTDFLSRGRQLKRQIYLLSAKSCTFTA